MHAILESFDQSIQEVRKALSVCDVDSLNVHFTKRLHNFCVDHESDPSVSSDWECYMKKRSVLTIKVIP